MLNDERRSRVYQSAIEAAIKAYKEEHGAPPVVLDLGTGE